MPRGRKSVNPHPEGSAESVEWEVQEITRQAEKQAEREANPRVVATERNITVTVSVAAIDAAKALGTLSAMPYRQVLAQAAQSGVEALVAAVQARLHPDSEGAMPF
jgi:predicted DNA binding CopG/RHH family protein